MQAVASQYWGQLKTLKVLSTPYALDLHFRQTAANAEEEQLLRPEPRQMSSYKPESDPALSQVALVN
jgi:hypothetical protein